MRLKTVTDKILTVCVLVTQSCLTLCDPMDYRPPGSSVQWIFQQRVLEWVAIPFSRGSCQPGDQTWSPALRADSLPSEPQGKPGMCPTLCDPMDCGLRGSFIHGIF